jgi:hypothetical protein
VSPNTTPGATPASTPLTPDPNVTRDGNTAARAITATERSDNPINDRTRQRGDTQTSTGEQLSQSDQQALAKLQARDRAVRAHEQAHLAAAGSLARSGANFTFQQGPDGRRYAIGGEVSIDTSEVSGDPDATIRQAQRVRAAALAPVNPSATDRAVAAEASRTEASARAEQAAEARQQQQTTTDTNRASQAFNETEKASDEQPPSIDTFA